jgi:hypothetical protein
MRILFLLWSIAVAGCGSSAPTPTGATCPDPANPQLTWSNFGSNFFCHYCTNCHRSDLPNSKRNGAPLFHDFDTLFFTMEVAVHTDEQAASGPKAHNTFMPGAGTGGKCPTVAGGPLDENCPEPTDEERANLGTFLACETQRQQDYNDTDAGVSDHCAHYTGP